MRLTTHPKRSPNANKSQKPERHPLVCRRQSGVEFPKKGGRESEQPPDVPRWRASCSRTGVCRGMRENGRRFCANRGTTFSDVVNAPVRKGSDQGRKKSPPGVACPWPPPSVRPPGGPCGPWTASSPPPPPCPGNACEGLPGLPQRPPPLQQQRATHRAADQLLASPAFPRNVSIKSANRCSRRERSGVRVRLIW